MTGRIFQDKYQFDSHAEANQQNQQSLQQSQQAIYDFLKNLVNNYSPETVLEEFKNLFILGDSTVTPEGLRALYKIIFSNEEEEFKNTLKRGCYILINNWASQRKHNFIQKLVQILSEVTETYDTRSKSLSRLRNWVKNFIKSKDYQELTLFASPYAPHWSHRYASYLLVPQYLDSSNPSEQRELARNLSKRLKEKFKIDLAIYTARYNSSPEKEKELPNPTKLGNKVIDLIKKVVSKTTLFDYTNQSHIFLKQTRELNYRDFKLSLQNYLYFDLNEENSLGVLKAKVSEKLEHLYESHHQEQLNIDLLLRTCRRVIEWLTTEDGQEPSYVFILLNTQGNTLPLVIILLKIILICQYVRTHLEVCIAKLIAYYENYPETECKWVINFLEIFNLVFAIYAENVQYNLVKVKENDPDSQRGVDLDAYRVFSQLKSADLRGNDLSSADLRNTDLSAADLRGANLRGADLSQADLSLAKLSKANMSSANLNGAELIAAELNGADLSSARMSDTKLRRAVLRQINLSSAKLSRANLNASDLSGADLRDADLQYADLSNVNLINANLSGANLQYADLSNTNLSHAKLSGANLQYANLSNANLSHANLSGANIECANLSHANLQGANVSEAKLNRADLEYVNLRAANLKGTFLRHAKLSDASLSSANLSRADLSYAELRHGDLSGTDLSDALLRHVNLPGADLSGANLQGANLFGTSLDGANVKNTQLRENAEFFEITPV